jgi:hypothetical protein
LFIILINIFFFLLISFILSSWRDRLEQQRCWWLWPALELHGHKKPRRVRCETSLSMNHFNQLSVQLGQFSS